MSEKVEEVGVGQDYLSNNEKEEIIQRHIERIKRQKKEKIENSCIPDVYLHYTWRDYKTDSDTRETSLPEQIIKSRKEARDNCVAYCLSLKKMIDPSVERKNISFIIMGKSGSGKSVLGTLILREVVNILNESILYVNFNSMVIDCFSANFQEHIDKLLEKYIEPEFLMIDEVEHGHKINEKTQSLFSIVLARRAEEGKGTIITASVDQIFDIKKILGHSAFRVIQRNDAYKKPIYILTKEENVSLDIFNETTKFDISVVKNRLEQFIEKQGPTITSLQMLNILNGSIYKKPWEKK